MMTYRWIIFAIAATMFGGAAWYFGRPEMPKQPPVETNPILASSRLPEAPKELPPEVIEVIDLASAYQPVREPQLPSGIDPASFLEDSKAPARIPYAVDNLDIDAIRIAVGAYVGIEYLRTFKETTSIQPREVSDPLPISILLDVMPREVK